MWQFLHRPTMKDPSHSDGKLFRLRFRVPYKLFEKLLSLWTMGRWHISSKKQKHCDTTGRSSMPIELKLFAVLRVRGKGQVVLIQYCRIDQFYKEAHRVFFHKFVKVLVENLFECYVPPLTSDESVSQVMRRWVYRLCGKCAYVICDGGYHKWRVL